MKVAVEPYGRGRDGEYVSLFRLDNGEGIRAAIATYGGRVTWLEVPDRKRRRANVVLGLESLEAYETEGGFLGALIGRFANRIADAQFSLDGRTYRLPANDGRNHLHGGPRGFHARTWSGEPLEEPEAVGVRLRHVSPEGEMGYPGTLRCSVEYRLNRASELSIDYQAETDRATPINLTHHGYFNLAGRGDVLRHELSVTASRFAPIDAERIPTGELASVEGTSFDFRKPKAIGSAAERSEPQLEHGRGGYDHDFALEAGRDLDLPVTLLVDPESGRALEMLTGEPALRVYTGQNLRGPCAGRVRSAFGRYGGICLEAGRFANAPNEPRFPSAILRPGETYHQRTVYRFFVA